VALAAKATPTPDESKADELDLITVARAARGVPPDVVGWEQIASLFGVTVLTVRRWEHARGLPVVFWPYRDRLGRRRERASGYRDRLLTCVGVRGWTNIGRALGVDGRTARRWEQSRGLPVERDATGHPRIALEALVAWQRGESAR
jgi:hypothetical protein